MKPHRIILTHKLTISYGLYKEMKIFRPFLIDKKEMKVFHSKDYINFLRKVNIMNKYSIPINFEHFNFNIDCPVILRLNLKKNILIRYSINFGFFVKKLQEDLLEVLTN